jgi:tRNA-dihydrouridine synthase
MIGRGCYGRPWFLAQAAHYLRTGMRLPEPSLARQKAILVGHYHGMLSQFGTGPGVRLARKHVSWYSRGLPGSAEFRATMNRLADAGSVLGLIDRFYDPLIAHGVTRGPAIEADPDEPGGDDTGLAAAA